MRSALTFAVLMVVGSAALLARDVERTPALLISRIVEVDDDGAFSVRLPAGKYRSACRRVGTKRGPVEFEVEEGGEVVLELVFP